MKTKLYRKWLKTCNDEVIGGAEQVFQEIMSADYYGTKHWSIEHRMKTHKNLIGDSMNAKIRMVNHILAWCVMADHARSWEEFKKKHEKYSRKYWTSEARLLRTIKEGKA